MFYSKTIEQITENISQKRGINFITFDTYIRLRRDDNTDIALFHFSNVLPFCCSIMFTVQIFVLLQMLDNRNKSNPDRHFNFQHFCVEEYTSEKYSRSVIPTIMHFSSWESSHTKNFVTRLLVD